MRSTAPAGARLPADGEKTSEAGSGVDREARALGSLEVPRSGLLALGLALCSALLILYLSRRLAFYYDEWSYIIDSPGAPPAYFLEPHNEHWATTHKLAYQALFTVFGIRTYLPYMALLAAVNAATGLVLFALIRRRSGSLLALAALPLLLFMGRGYEDLLWAFQTMFVGSVGLGLAAIYLLEGAAVSAARLAVASACLLCSVATSSIGLFFVVALAVELGLDRGRRSRLAALALPVIAYAAWYAVFGRAAKYDHNLSARTLQILVEYIPLGIGSSVGALAGLSLHWAYWTLAALAALAGAQLARRGSLDPRLAGAAAGLLAQFTITGLGRAQFGADQASASRYMYVGGALALVLVTGLLTDVRLWRRQRMYAGVLLVVVATYSASLLIAQSGGQAAKAGRQQAELQVLAAVRGAPELDRNAVVDRDLMPQVPIARYYVAVDTYGSPVSAPGPDPLQTLDPAVVDRELRAGFGSRVSVAAAPAPARPCGSVDPLGGRAELQVPGGGSVLVASQRPQPVRVYLWYRAALPADPTAVLTVPAGASRIRLPDVGTPIVWSVRLEPAGPTPLEVCPLG